MDKKLIKIISNATTWEDAIKLGVQLSVDNGFCTNEYAEKIIESVNKNGPYFILMPNLALAHASPGSYIKKVGLTLVKFNKPVKFSKEKKHNVQLLFTLTAMDSDSHMEKLMKFAELFSSNPNLIDKVVESEDINEIHNLLKTI